MRGRRNEQGQSVLEYSVLIAVVVLVIVGGQIYFKRSLQGRWKDTAEQFGEQFTTAQTYTTEMRQQSVREEVTGTTGEVTDHNWTRSSVKEALPQDFAISSVGGKETGYTGHETTRKDYVTATTGGGQIGQHGTFDSGQLSQIKLFEDD